MSSDAPTSQASDEAASNADAVVSRILVAVSSPQASERLVVPVADFARRMNAEVLVVHVSKPAGGGQRGDRETGDEAVNTLGETIRKRGVPVQTLLMFSDDVARAILNTAEQQRASLIMLGLTGKGVFQRLIEGNVPVELLRETRLPVMLLPPDFSGTL
ncbi:MAG: universal stress protein [Planctomycetota bacterium]